MLKNILSTRSVTPEKFDHGHTQALASCSVIGAVLLNGHIRKKLDLFRTANDFQVALLAVSRTFASSLSCM